MFQDSITKEGPNPVDPFRRGLGQAEALADEIETDEYAAKFQRSTGLRSFITNISSTDTGMMTPLVSRTV